MIDFFEFVAKLQPAKAPEPKIDAHTAYIAHYIDGKSFDELSAWMGFPADEIAAEVAVIRERERAFNAACVRKFMRDARGM